MTEIVLVKQAAVDLSEAEKETVRRVVFGIVDGLGDRGRKQWRRLWNGILRLEPGEMLHLSTLKKRSGPFHRRHMAIEQAVFEAQERIQSFEDFRTWLKIGAGFVTWMAGPKGGVVPVPKSIAYSELEDGDMRDFHEAAMAFLRGPHASNYLWPRMPAKHRDDAINAVLMGFGE